MKLILLTVLVIVFCAWIEEVWAAKAIAELRVSPNFMTSRGDIHVVVALKSGAPTEGLWKLTWQADGGPAGSTKQDIEDDGQRTWDIWLKSYPPGRYGFALEIWDKDKKSAGVITWVMPDPDGGQR